MLKKLLIAFGVILFISLLGYAGIVYVRNFQPHISRQPTMWERENITEAEYRAREAEESETLSAKEATERFNDFTGLPQFTQISTESVNYFLNEDLSVGTGYLAIPEGDGPFPGIIMIHDSWGLNEQTERKARTSAGQGYAVLAVDLYGGSLPSTQEEAEQMAASVNEFNTQALSNLGFALRYLTNKPEVDGESVTRVGSTFKFLND